MNNMLLIARSWVWICIAEGVRMNQDGERLETGRIVNPQCCR